MIEFRAFCMSDDDDEVESDLNDQRAGRPRHIPSNGMHPGA